MVSPPNPEQLLDLYRIAIDEYRFEVKLGWDRAMYYMVFNTAIVSIATGLLKLDNPRVVYLFIAGIFLLGCVTSLMGVKAVTRCHEYYRRTVVKKTLIEDLLGLTTPLADYSGHTLTIGTTAGQGDHIQILQNTEPWVGRRLRRYSIMFWVTSLLRLLAGINLLGVFVAGYMFWNPPAKFHEPRQPFILPVAIRLVRDETAPASRPGRRNNSVMAATTFFQRSAI